MKIITRGEALCINSSASGILSFSVFVPANTAGGSAEAYTGREVVYSCAWLCLQNAVRTVFGVRMADERHPELMVPSPGKRVRLAELRRRCGQRSCSSTNTILYRSRSARRLTRHR